jgi:hypothetical protein
MPKKPPPQPGAAGRPIQPPKPCVRPDLHAAGQGKPMALPDEAYFKAFWIFRFPRISLMTFE